MDQVRLGFLFGVFAGVLLFIGALVTLAGGVASLVTGGFSTNLLINATTRIVLEIVFGVLFVFFAAFSTRRTGTYTRSGEFIRTGDYSLAGGVIVIIVALGTWYVLGLHLFEALAGIFGLIAGILLILARRY